MTPKNCGYHELKPILMKYIHTAKDCGWGCGTSCIPNSSFLTEEQKEKGYNKYKTLNGATDIYMRWFDDGQFIINDGSLVLLENDGVNSLYISVDVNGYNKRPNKLGIDLFMFQINNEGTLLPMGVKGTYYYNQNDAFCSWTSGGNTNGAGCTYKALYEKDYFKNLPR